MTLSRETLLTQSPEYGRLNPVVTRKDVALAAGVSEATVSRVLNGVGPMREDTKQRVLQVVNQLKYHPNAIAQSFARRRSGPLHRRP